MLLSIDGGTKRWFVHKLVLLAFEGPPPSPLHQGLHSNGDESWNFIGNLRWGTHAENMADREAHGTTQRGSRNGLAKLVESDVRSIKLALAAGTKGRTLASLYDVSAEVISTIKRGKAWTHV